MDSITISGVSPLVDGSYPFEWRSFSTAEWSWIKKLSGYLPGTIEDGWTSNDPELVVAFAVIAMARSGKIGKPQALAIGQLLWEADGDDVVIEFTAGVDEVADAGPPVLAPASASSSDGSSSTSGTGSETSSGSQETTLSPSGLSGLVSEPTFVRETLAS